MSDDFSPIRPKQVPLSHAAPAERASVGGRGASALTWGLGLLLIGGLLVLVFFLVPAWLESSGGLRPEVAVPAEQPPRQSEAAARDTRSGQSGAGDKLPPFQQLQREQAREKAQSELAEFVELQIELEENMQVGDWGAAQYDQAKNLAAAGDEQFVREQYQDSVTSYQHATEALSALIERGKALLEESIERGNEALAARNPAAADEAFAMARTIAPDDPRVAAGEARAATLPEINTLMREARNQELAEQWSQAAATYDEVAALDPATSGLAEARQRVEEGQRRTRVQKLLSEGFAQLEEQSFDAARRSFRAALALEPGNAVAEGGLEQVAKNAEVARINALKVRADTAAAEERWTDAAGLYQQVLDLDGTIQFAQSGYAQAQAQQRAAAALQRILDQPERLSSDQLFREAQEILQRAERLEPRGTELARRIDDVQATLETYANPVQVVLRSDNRTEVTLSTVGTLGSFEEKRLELRPGAYTVIGSRDGCRDVREQIVVRPNMSPVDIRCSETL